MLSVARAAGARRRLRPRPPHGRRRPHRLRSRPGLAANNAAPIGNPELAGAITFAKGAAPATVTAGNVAQLSADVEHRLFVNNVHPNFWSCEKDAVTVTTQCQAAPGASISLYVTDVWLANGSTTASVLNVVTGTGTNCATGATNVIPPTGLASNAAAGDFVSYQFATPIKVAANQAVCCKTAGTTAFGCVLSGFTGP